MSTASLVVGSRKSIGKSVGMKPLQLGNNIEEDVPGDLPENNFHFLRFVIIIYRLNITFLKRKQTVFIVVANNARCYERRISAALFADRSTSNP